MRLFVPKETVGGETRVAASPETVKKLAGMGFDVVVESGAGQESRIPDSQYEAAGATIGNAAGEADVVLKVRRPTPDEARGYKRGALVLASMDPYGNEGDVAAMADAGLSAFAMEFMPRITRAQVMDVLSSQANLAGYQAVIEGAAVYDRALPMMMTAAGTVPAARVFVMGAGVAGLQAIATARRLGAIVTATDVRPAAKEQVESLGAKFIAVEDDEFRQAETAGGYAKEMSKEYQAKQAALVASHIAKQDIVITTALIPGRPAPKLVTTEMLAVMQTGAVIVDLAVERGGNVEGAVAGEVVQIGGVRIVGYPNMAGRIAATASLLYAKNLLAFFETMVDKAGKTLAVNWDDELVKATLLTRDGAIVHPAFKLKDMPLPVAAPAPEPEMAPAAQAEEAQTAEPVAEAQQEQAVQPSEPVAEAQPEQSWQPAEPVADAQPEQSLQPSEPVAEAQPEQSWQPSEPVADAQPEQSWQPAEPVAEAQPEQSWQQSEPAAEAQQEQSWQPAEPVAEAQPEQPWQESAPAEAPVQPAEADQTHEQSGAAQEGDGNENRTNQTNQGWAQ